MEHTGDTSRRGAPWPDGTRFLLALALVLGMAFFFARLELLWAQPHQEPLRDTIPSPTPSKTRTPTSIPGLPTPTLTATDGPAATATPTVGPCVRRALLQQGLDVDGSPYAGTRDTYLDASHPLWPHFGEARLKLKGADAYHVLIRFDLSMLPSGASIVAAELAFYVDSNEALRPLEVSAFRVLRAWEPAQTTWNETAAGVSWAVPGCNGVGVDRVGEADDTIALEHRGVWRGFDVSQSVRYWMQHPDQNYGWLLKGVDASNAGYLLYSSFWWEGQRALRPMLRVDYWECVATPTPTQTGTPGATPTSTPMRPTATPTPPGGRIVASVFLDQNRNRVHDPEEPGLTDVRVKLFSLAYQELAQQLTGADGTCTFWGLSTGEYRVRQISPWGHISTTGDEQRTFAFDGQVTRVEFGSYPGYALALPLVLR